MTHTRAPLYLVYRSNAATPGRTIKGSTLDGAKPLTQVFRKRGEISYFIQVHSGNFFFFFTQSILKFSKRSYPNLQIFKAAGPLPLFLQMSKIKIWFEYNEQPGPVSGNYCPTRSILKKFMLCSV